MKFLKIPLRILFLIACMAILTKAWIIYSSSFRLDKIDPKELFDNHFKINLVEEDLSKIVNQKYRFLNKGRQSFVFVSDDKKYVLKLFRFHRYRSSIFNNFLSSFNLAKRYTKKMQDEKNDLYYESMNSYKLVYENLQDETATIYVHLNKTNHLNKKLQIEDKFKVQHVINLNLFGFVIQKKASSFKRALLKTKDDKKNFEILLNSFFDNLQSIYSKNLLNKDRHVIQNLGVVNGNKVVEIDIGRFIIKNDFNKEKIKFEATHYITYLKKWLLKNMPRRVEFLDEKLLGLINNTNIKSQEELNAI